MLLSGMEVANIIPFRLKGNAFTVFAQLPEDRRRDCDAIKTALLEAFALKPLTAYEQFAGKKNATWRITRCVPG